MLGHLHRPRSPSPTRVVHRLGRVFHSSENFVWLVCDLIEVTWLLLSEVG